MTYEEFAGILDKQIFGSSYASLLKVISEHPERYLGIFRPTKTRTKLIQNITQSHEIKFGSALENIFEEYFRRKRFIILNKHLTKEMTSTGKKLDIDQLFKHPTENKIYLIEQKVRDDHDSSKKRGQFDNFEKKYKEIHRIYPEYTVIPIMRFIDPDLDKNKTYYQERISSMVGCTPLLCYGKELFDTVDSFDVSIRNEVKMHLTAWNDTVPEKIEEAIDFDSNSEGVFEEIKDLKIGVYSDLFDNADIKNNVFPILFPRNIVLKKLRNYFNTQTNNKKKYKELAKAISEYIGQETEEGEEGEE